MAHLSRGTGPRQASVSDVPRIHPGDMRHLQVLEISGIGSTTRALRTLPPADFVDRVRGAHHVALYGHGHGFVDGPVRLASIVKAMDSALSRRRPDDAYPIEGRTSVRLR
ncbi:MAG: hypothetical protein MNPFHGCM_00676 [Gemmatimonadaceae bacterium]|nr:hypothetical protein [Gemmatimonadaceae bacterium]